MNNKIIRSVSRIFFLIVLLCILPFLLPSLYWVSVFVTIGINILLVTSLRMIGLIGQFSLGHVGFMAIGAYCSALLTMKAGFPFWVSLITGGLLAAIVALILAYPFLKVRGLYFSILTLLTGETIRLVAWNWRTLTGGTDGLLNIPSPPPITIAGFVNIQFESFYGYYYLTLFIVTISISILYYIERSKAGFIWRAINETDNLTKCVGINTMKFQVVNFVIGCFFAGIAGALYAHFERSLSADYSSRFGMLMSIYLIVYLVVGGPTKFFGPILGVAILVIVSELVRPLGESQAILLGIVTILIVLYMPEGIIGMLDQLRKYFLKLLKKRVITHLSKNISQW